MSSKRAAGLVGALAVIGLAISAYIARVHAQIAADQTPGCDINETLSCTSVLSSKYAYVFGIPVAWWALAAYVAFGVAALLLTFSLERAQQRRRVAGLVFAAAIGAAIYSVALACVAVVVLHAVCLFCSGLYAVNAGMLVASALLLSAVRRESARTRGEADFSFVRWVGIGSLVGLVAVSVVLAWGASRPPVQPDPDFELWYKERPIVKQLPSGGHSKGAEGSAVVISEFSDFECGHCANVYRTLKLLWPRYRNDLRIEFHHYPLDSACNPAMTREFHRNACLAAIASECASAQNRFWPYHDLLFENQQHLGRDDLIRYADDVGLDREQFAQCLDGEEARAAVARDIAQAERLEVKSTPTLFFNERTVVGALEEDKFELAIRIERDLSTRRN
jgi:protein-disulfide isomerase